MMMLGPLGFAIPWMLAAGAMLPVLWFLLRAVPPSPREVVFPGTALLLGLTDPAPITRHTPWWLLLVRLLEAQPTLVAEPSIAWDELVAGYQVRGMRMTLPGA